MATDDVIRGLQRHRDRTHPKLTNNNNNLSRAALRNIMFNDNNAHQLT